MLILTTFWSFGVIIQHFIADSSLLCFSCFSVDKVKLVKLGNWVLLLPTHPSWLFLHFLGLACFFISLTTHSCFFQFVRSLIYLGSALATYGVCYILVSLPFLALWVVSIQLDFPMWDVLFMYTVIHHYSMEGYTSIFISSFMWFSLFSSLYFSCVCLWEFLVARSISCAYS